MRSKKQKAKYSSDMPGKMYRYFISYDDRGAPSINKFARNSGMTSDDIEGFRKHKKFDKAYRECCEIRKDYLIDRALDKRFDASFVKFLLSYESGVTEDNDDKNLTLHLEVSE